MSETKPRHPIHAQQLLVDPVCGMTVAEQSLHVIQHEGKSVYFCGVGCKVKFALSPAKYLLAPSRLCGSVMDNT